jgi:hypothetical protein
MTTNLAVETMGKKSKNVLKIKFLHYFLALDPDPGSGLRIRIHNPGTGTGTF